MTKETLPSLDQFESLDFSKLDEANESPAPISLFDGELTDSELMLQPDELADTVLPSNTTWVQQEKPLLPSEQWANPATTRRQQMLMIAMVGMFSLFVAVGSFYAFVRWVAVPDPAGTSATNSASQADLQADPPVDQPPATGPDSDNAASSSPPAPVGTESDQNSDPAPASPEIAAGNSPVASPDPNTQTQTQSTDPKLPVENLPENLPATIGTGATVTLGTANNQPIAALSLPESLQEIAKILDATKTPVVDSSIPIIGPAMDKDDPDAAEPFADPKNENQAPPATEIDQALQIEVEGISVVKRPLSEAFNVLAQIADLPLAVDFDSLASAQIDRRQVFDFKAVNLSAGDILNDFASQLGAQFEQRATTGLTLVASPDRLVEKISNSLDISNLETDKQVIWAQSLDALFPDKKEPWKLVAGHIEIEQTNLHNPQWLQLSSLIANWQRFEARSAHAPSFPFAAIEKALDLKLTLKIKEPKQLWVILSEVFREAKLNCWFDWPSLRQTGVTPQTSGVCVTHQRYLKEVLQELRRRHELVFVIDDPQTVIVTTRPGRIAQLKAYIFDANNQTADQWKQHLELVEPSELAGLPPFRIAISPSGAIAIIRCARFEIGL